MTGNKVQSNGKKYDEFDLSISQRLSRLETKLDLICAKIEAMEKRGSNLAVGSISALVAGCVSYIVHRISK